MGDVAIPGDANFICERSGFKGKMSDSVVEWNGLRVLRRFAEERPQQDFVRGVKDDASVKDGRPEAADTFIIVQVRPSDL